MIKMSLFDATKILHCPNLAQEDIIFNGISTDTRTLIPGNLFIAITGEQFDGHHFIQEALQKGACAALVSRPIESPLPQLLVKDTLIAFGQLAHFWRMQFSLPIIGVTGSNGKTTLKNMIASILKAACHDDSKCVLATEGNLNNNIGVPIMLSRLNNQHRYAVIEMGMNHFGEIAYLTQLAKPCVAVINNAAAAHLEGLKSVEGVAQAKGEIFLGLSKEGTAILNQDDTYFDYWKKLCENHQQITFGLQNDANVTAITTHNPLITLQTPKGTIDVTLPLLGRHNIMNALAATAATLALGIELSAIKKGLENVQPAHGRMQQYVLATGTRIIDDTYNANPTSLQAAVETVAALAGEKIIVLGDMKELGPDAKKIHFTAGEKMKTAGIHHLFTFGEMSEGATEAFGNNARHFIHREELIIALQPYLKSNTTILIKGSRSMRMEKIVNGLIPEEQLNLTH